VPAMMAALGAGATVGFILPISRAQESEADRIGLVLMALAGYDPREAIVVWERMHAANTGRRQAEWLSTHPADTTRLADIRQWLPEAMKYYRPRD
jgi:predicted Zn-dependent protease